MEYGVFLDQLSDAVIIASPDGVVRFANHAFGDLLGWDPQELVDTPITRLVPFRHRLDPRRGLDEYAEALEGGGPPDPVHVVVLRADGTEADVELRISRAETEDGPVFVGLVRNASEYVALARTVAVSRYLRASLDATVTLQAIDHPDQAMTTLLHVLCDRLDWDVAVIWRLDEDDHLTAVDVWRAEDAPAAAIDAMTRRLRLGPGEGLPGKVLSTRGPRVVPDVTASEFYLRVEASRQAGLVTGVGFPLVADEQILGVIEFFSRRLRLVDDELTATLEAIGRQLGAYLARVSSQAAMQELAETLQAALLPPTLPEVPGLDLAALYHPGTEHVSVGGDIYDVFRVSRDTWGLFIADVCGKGADAASVTALARHTVRATALENPTPTHVAAALNRALLEGGDRPFLTAIFAVLERTGEDRSQRAHWDWTVELVCAGHPLPVLVTEDGPRIVGEPGTLLGVTKDPGFTPVRIALTPGETLVMYTDGVTEARNPSGELFGEGRLLRALSQTEGTSEQAISQVAGAVQRHVGDVADGDDVAILAVTTCPPR